MDINHPPHDSYILVVKVVNAKEPCAGKTSDLVGILNLIDLHWCNAICNLSNPKLASCMTVPQFRPALTRNAQLVNDSPQAATFVLNLEEPDSSNAR